MPAEVFRCPTCGAPLDYDGGPDLTITCPFCKQSVIVPETLRRPPRRGGMVALSEGTLQQIRELADSGRVTEAAMLYRNTTGVSMQEAEEAVKQFITPSAMAAAPLPPAEAEAAFRRVKELGLGGDKIGAIREYRQAFGVGLKEAKDAVERMEAGGWMEKVYPSFAAQPLANQQEVIHRIVKLAQSGQKIEAIKLFREQFDVSLADAKASVEAMAAAGQWVMVHQHPAAQPEAQPAPPSAESVARQRRTLGCILGAAGAVVAVGVAAAVLVITLFARSSTQVLEPLVNDAETMEVLAPTAEPSNYTVELQFGEEGINPGYFEDIRSIAVDPEGLIYAAEYLGGRVQVFDAEGNFLRQWLVDEKLPLYAITADREGILYIAQGGRVTRYDGATGENLGDVPLPENFYTKEVKITPDGRLAVFNISGQHQVLLMKPDGEIVLELLDPFKDITGSSQSHMRIAVDGRGNIYLLGSNPALVLKYDKNGKYIDRFGSEGDDAEQFDIPEDLAVDSTGQIYIADRQFVKIFASDGRYIESLEFRPGQLAYGLAMDYKDRLLVTFRTYITRLVLP